MIAVSIVVDGRGGGGGGSGRGDWSKCGLCLLLFVDASAARLRDRTADKRARAQAHVGRHLVDARDEAHLAAIGLPDALDLVRFDCADILHAFLVVVLVIVTTLVVAQHLVEHEHWLAVNATLEVVRAVLERRVELSVIVVLTAATTVATAASRAPTEGVVIVQQWVVRCALLAACCLLFSTRLVGVVRGERLRRARLLSALRVRHVCSNSSSSSSSVVVVLGCACARGLTKRRGSRGSVGDRRTRRPRHGPQ